MGARHLSSNDLPTPDAGAQAHSERLSVLIRHEMDAAGGSLPFDHFMDMALYAPGLGYYVAGSHKLGEQGDFVTAPGISPLFGRSLARQCAQVLESLGGGDILEFGAGSGSLALEMLQEMDRLGRLPGRYLILEPSPELRARQVDTLSGPLSERVQWLDRPPGGFRGIMLANEVLDAMPVHRFGLDQGRIGEVRVHWNGDGFEEHVDFSPGADLKQAVERLVADLGDLSEDYLSEINLRAGPWIHSLAPCLDAGLLLLIDYGYPQREYYLPERKRGTLMCHYRHRAHPDPYRLVGLQDITAYVDFSRVAQAGIESGLSLAGYATQAHFLLGCGIEALMAQIDPADTLEHMQAAQGVKHLLLPGAMGERFQVMGLSRGIDDVLMGFSLRDLRARL